jgi:hypothetical protein
MSITSIGYGDIYDTSEQVVGLVLMLIAGILWAATIGTLTSVIAKSPEMQQHRDDLDAMNKYFDEHAVDCKLRQRLREFFLHSITLRRNRSTQSLLAQMSPALQAELILQTNGYWLSAIKLLRTPESDDAPEVPTLPASDSFSSKSRRASARKSMYAKAAQHGLQTTYLPTEGLTEAQRLHRCFLVEVSLGLIPVVFAPGESVSQNYVTVITNGIALLNGSKILHEGSAVGQDSLLSAKWLRKQDTAVAINYLVRSSDRPHAHRMRHVPYMHARPVVPRAALLLHAHRCRAGPCARCDLTHMRLSSFRSMCT